MISGSICPPPSAALRALPGRRTVKKDAQAAWLLKAITCIDLTTLNGDDTAERVQRLCAKARSPVRSDILEALGFAGRRLHTPARSASITASSRPRSRRSRVPAFRSLRSRLDFRQASCRIDLSSRRSRRPSRTARSEIDIVITREHVLDRRLAGALRRDRGDFRAACGDAHLKAILATGDLETLRNVAKASMVCMMAGADFIKTSTGKEGVNATLPVTWRCCA